MKKNSKSGSAIPLVLIFAFIMFVLALAYSKLTQTSKLQSVQIDERLKMDYAMESISELALLKYQLYPADYYVCRELARAPYNDNTYYEQFLERGVTNTPFRMIDNHCISNFNKKEVNVELGSIEIITTNKWNTEALIVTSSANYSDIYGRTIDKTNTRLYEIQRFTDTSLIEVTPTAP